MSGPEKKYCLDTSAFIKAKYYYPIDIFGSIWRKFEEWGKSGRVLASVEVRTELFKVDDELSAWAKANPYLFLPPVTAVQESLQEVNAKYPNLCDESKGLSMADPWVVAQARVSRAVVVTEENRSNGPRPKIPNACAGFRIECIKIVDLIRALGLKF